MSKIVGDVAIEVGADVSALVREMKRGTGALGALDDASNRVGRGLEKMGDRMTALGKRLSVLSAGIAAVTGAAFALTKSYTESAAAVRKFSQISNASTTEFQRMAYASKSVGIEQEKLADIFKDVNDRVGDFMTTGGGPMADFFENIAPKVGVTADQFARLSGPEALQLYVSSLEKAGASQQEMTFYMEAMASDATALIPLLANGGKEMARLGDAAEDAGAVMGGGALSASARFTEKMNELGMKFAGVRNELAEALLPLILDRLIPALENTVIPAIQSVVTSIGEWINWFGQLDPAIQTVVGTIVGAFAVGGPVLLAIGEVSSAIGIMIAKTGPIGLFIAAAAGLSAAWVAWGDEFKAAVGGAVEWVTAKFEAFLSMLDRIVEKAVAVKDAVAAALTAGPYQEGQAASREATPGWMNESFGDGQITGGGAGGAMGGQMMGAAIVNGAVLGVVQQMEAQRAALGEAFGQITGIAKEALGIQSPSTVFAEIGRFLGMGMAQGINDSTTLVGDAVKGMTGTAVGAANEGVSGILGAMGNLFQGSKKISAGIALANSWMAFTEVLKDPSFIGRPFARFSAAASALAAGLNAVKNIKAAQPGGGGGGGGGSSGSASGGGGGGGIANITLVGESFSRDGVESLFAQLNEGLRQGRTINLVRG